MSSIGPWPKGIVNSSRDYVLPKGACLDALNVDFTDEGHALSRTGFSQTEAVDNGHSPEQSRHKGDVLQRPGPRGDHRRQSAGHHHASDRFEHPSGVLRRTRREVWWSNGEEGRCNSDNSDHPWTVSCTFGYCFCRRGYWNATDWNVSRLHYGLDDERRRKPCVNELKH